MLTIKEDDEQSITIGQLALINTPEFLIGYLSGKVSFSGDTKAPRITVRGHLSDLHILQALKSQFGGSIFGPTTMRSNQKSHIYYDWFARGKDLRSMISFLNTNLPESTKRNQFLVWVAKYKLEAFK